MYHRPLATVALKPVLIPSVRHSKHILKKNDSLCVEPFSVTIHSLYCYYRRLLFRYEGDIVAAQRTGYGIQTWHAADGVSPIRVFAGEWKNDHPQLGSWWFSEANNESNSNMPATQIGPIRESHSQQLQY